MNRAAAPNALPDAAGAPGPAAPRAKILVVDDDRLVLATVTHGLQQAGYDVVDADNGDDAILLAREHRPQLALLDIRMEGKSGFDVAEVLRDAYQIPFMFLSAFADEATLRQVERLGAQAYLIKPLDVGQIVPNVAAVLARLAAQPPSPVATAEAPPAARPADPLVDPVPLAVGLLMHRHSLNRRQALQRLHKLAQDHQRSAAQQAERLLAAVEELAASGD